MLKTILGEKGVDVFIFGEGQMFFNPKFSYKLIKKEPSERKMCKIYKQFINTIRKPGNMQECTVFLINEEIKIKARCCFILSTCHPSRD